MTAVQLSTTFSLLGTNSLRTSTPDVEASAANNAFHYDYPAFERYCRRLSDAGDFFAPRNCLGATRAVIKCSVTKFRNFLALCREITYLTISITDVSRSVASPGMGHWGTCPPEFANARKVCSRSNYGCAYLSAEFS